MQAASAIVEVSERQIAINFGWKQAAILTFRSLPMASPRQSTIVNSSINMHQGACTAWLKRERRPSEDDIVEKKK
jgi:hypothetical protein